MRKGILGEIAGVPVFENKYLPKGFVVIVGKTCRYCGEDCNPFGRCPAPENFMKPHFPEYKIVKVTDG